MYHGQSKFTQLYYRDQYVAGVGTLSTPAGRVVVERHLYACDHCGHAYTFAEAATEPFYCHSAACGAVKLVSLTPAQEA